MSVESKVVDLRGHKVVLVMSSEFDLDYVFITPNLQIVHVTLLVEPCDLVGPLVLDSGHVMQPLTLTCPNHCSV